MITIFWILGIMVAICLAPFVLITLLYSGLYLVSRWWFWLGLIILCVIFAHATHPLGLGQFRP